MDYFLKTQVGRLRLIGFLEGISLLILIFIAVPMKHFYKNPSLVSNMGPIHGMLFLLFIFYTISVGVEEKWKFSVTTWKVLIACIIPFGTFYIDRHILKKAQQEKLVMDQLNK
ncbi:integral membrane protein [Pedobacter sp. UYP24]